MIRETLIDRNEVTTATGDSYCHVVVNGVSKKIKKSNLQKDILTGYIGPLAIADTPTQDGYYMATETGTYTNAGSLVVDLADGVNYINVSATQTVFDLTIVTLSIEPVGAVEIGDFEAVSGNVVYRSQTDRFLETGLNLYDKTLAGEDFYYNNSTGVKTANAGWSVSGLIPVESSTAYNLSSEENESFGLTHFYSASGTWIGSNTSIPVTLTSTGANSFSFTTPSSCKFVGVWSQRPSTTHADWIDGLQLTLGIVKLDYEAFFYASKETLLTPFGEIVKEEIRVEFLEVGKNKFDPSLAVEDRYYLNLAGTDLPLVGVAQSGLQVVSPNTQYTISKTTGVLHRVHFWTSAGVYLGDITTLGSPSSTSDEVSSRTVTTPATCGLIGVWGYLLTQTFQEWKDEIQIEVGGSASIVSPYQQNIKYELVEEYFTDAIDEKAVKLYVNFENTANTVITAKHNNNTVISEVVPFLDLDPDVSNVFDFRKVTVNGDVISIASDEAAPNYVNGLFIGANHGYFKERITETAHGKTYVDVGSTWNDAATGDCIIVGIPDVNTIDVTIVTGVGSITGNTLTHVTGATNTGNIDSTTKSTIQFFPVTKNRSMRVYEGVNEITITGNYATNDAVTFKEAYDVMDKPSIVNWLKTQVGTATEILIFDGTPQFRVNHSYTFDRFGNCVIYTDFLALENITTFGFIMMNQKQAIETPYDVYIPKSLSFTHDTISYDFTDLTDITSDSWTTIMSLTPARIEATGLYANRVLMLRANSGMAIGFLPIQDAEVTQRRSICDTRALWISTSKKVYMSAVDSTSITSLTAGDYYSTVTYKSYFPIESGRTSFYIIPTNNAHYMYIDWHVDGVDFVSLPIELSGKTMTVIEKSSDVTILSAEIAGSISFDVASGSNYDYAILKFE